MSSSFNENIHSGSSKGLRKKGENPMMVLTPVCRSACVCVCEMCFFLQRTLSLERDVWSTYCMENI